MAATLINSSSNANSIMNNLAGVSDNCVSTNLCNSINNSNLLDQLDHSTAIRSKIAISDINNNSNSNNAISQNDLISTNLIVSNLNASANNRQDPTDSNRTPESNSHISNNNSYINSPDMGIVKQSSSLSSSVENSPQQQDYHVLNSNKKSTETINKGASYELNGLYSENAMDIKYISSDCVIYTFYTNLNTEIDNHFKRALNKSIYNNDNKNKGMYHLDFVYEFL